MFQGTVSGRGRIATITGEPGIGKTSLVEEVLAEIALGPHRPVIVRGRCSERLNGAEAYLPILEVLDSLLHGQTVGRFTDMMKTLAPTWYVHVGMLSVESTSAQQLKEDTKIASPERMKRELAALFESISRARPLVLFLDDLHWADISTVDVLNYLAQRFGDLRIFVMATYRSSEMVSGKHPFLQVSQDLQTRGTLQEFALDFLGLADVERYLDMEFPGHALARRTRRADPREDRRQSALHGGPAARPQGPRRHREGCRRLLEDREIDLRHHARAARDGEEHDRAQARSSRRDRSPAAHDRRDPGL